MSKTAFKNFNLSLIPTIGDALNFDTLQTNFRRMGIYLNVNYIPIFRVYTYSIIHLRTDKEESTKELFGTFEEARDNGIAAVVEILNNRADYIELLNKHNG